MDGLIEDDATEMLAIVNGVFVEVAEQHMLGKLEAQSLTASMAEALSGSVLRDMYASNDRAAFAKAIIELLIAPIVSSRKIIELPGEAEFAAGLYRLAGRADSEADTSKRILTNKDGSLQCNIPQGFVVYKELTKWNALPPVRHETDKVMIAAFRYKAVDTSLAADYVELHHTRRAQKPDFVHSTDVTAVHVGDRDCYGYRTEIVDAAYCHNAFRVIRLFDEFILLGLMATEEKLLLRHEDALDQMISSLSFNRIDPIVDTNWPVFFSRKGDYAVQAPPDWRVMENPPQHPEGTDVLLILHSDFCEIWVAARFDRTDGLTLVDGARNMANSASAADPYAVVSVESVTVAGREIAFAQVSYTSDGEPVCSMFALQHEDSNHMIAVSAVMRGSLPIGYREQCQDLVWRFTKATTKKQRIAAVFETVRA